MSYCIKLPFAAMLYLLANGKRQEYDIVLSRFAKCCLDNMSLVILNLNDFFSYAKTRTQMS